VPRSGEPPSLPPNPCRTSCHHLNPHPSLTFTLAHPKISSLLSRSLLHLPRLHQNHHPLPVTRFGAEREGSLALYYRSPAPSHLIPSIHAAHIAPQAHLRYATSHVPFHAPRVCLVNYPPLPIHPTPSILPARIDISQSIRPECGLLNSSPRSSPSQRFLPRGRKLQKLGPSRTFVLYCTDVRINQVGTRRKSRFSLGNDC